MLEYLEYLQDNFGDDFDSQVESDFLLSLAIYDENEEEEISVYELIDSYFEECKNVKESYQNLFEDMYEDIKDSDESDKIAILIKSMKIRNVEEIDDGYKFELSSSLPIKFSINLYINNTYYNNENDSTCVLKKYNEKEPHYELSISPNETDMRAITMAAIFNEWVDIDDLYTLLEDIVSINRKYTFIPHAETSLPISVEFSKMGVVEVYYNGANNQKELMRIVPDINLDLKRNYKFSDAFSLDCSSSDPIWMLKNMYVYLDESNFDEYTSGILDDIFKTHGYSHTLSYIEMREDDEEFVYYVYGNNNELSKIDFDYVNEGEDTYSFVFNDESCITYPKEKVVIVKSEIEQYPSLAVKKLK